MGEVLGGDGRRWEEVWGGEGMGGGVGVADAKLIVEICRSNCLGRKDPPLNAGEHGGSATRYADNENGVKRARCAISAAKSLFRVYRQLRHWPSMG